MPGYDSLSRRRLLGATAAGLAGTAGCLGLGSGGAGGATGQDGADPGEIDLAGKPRLGSTDAPLTLYYWTDFQCPFCAQFEAETLPKIREEYVSSGDLLVVTIPVAFFGEDSLTAAAAAKCVWRQTGEDDPDAYWAWHAAVYDEQGDKNSGWASRANLLDITESVEGVSADRVATCLDEDGDELRTAVRDAGDEAQNSFGVRGTPTFVVSHAPSGRWSKLVGAQPFDRFQSEIETVRSG
ncbi:DsbA family protein [Halobacteriaceae archaeon GCM10025711]